MQQDFFLVFDFGLTSPTRRLFCEAIALGGGRWRVLIARHRRMMIEAAN
jgi:hypothetical protein